MTEHFEILRDGRAFCLCEISLQGEENSICDELIAEAKKGIIGYASAFEPSTAEKEAVSGFRIVPYRYRLLIFCRPICECLLFIRISSSFDARFPGGGHRRNALGMIYDTALRRFLPPSFWLMPHISLKERRRLGAPLSFDFDGDGITLNCKAANYVLDGGIFCKNYKRIADFGLKFDKKTIDKQGNL